MRCPIKVSNSKGGCKMDGGVIFFFVVLIAIGNMIYKWYMAEQERQKEENFKLQHPKEYAQLKQMEHERQMMAHDEKRMKHQKVQAGVGIFSEIFHRMLK